MKIEQLIYLLLGLVLCCVLIFVLQARAISLLKLRSVRPDFQRRSFLSPVEINAYRKVSTAAGKCKVFAKVPVTAVLTLSRESRSQESLSLYNSVAAMRLDFLICTESMEAICAVKLLGNNANPAKFKECEAALASAGIETLYYQASNMPSVSKIAGDIALLIPLTGEEVSEVDGSLHGPDTDFDGWQLEEVPLPIPASAQANSSVERSVELSGVSRRKPVKSVLRPTVNPGNSASAVSGRKRLVDEADFQDTDILANYATR